MRVAALVPAYPPRSHVGAWVATHGFLAHLVTLGHQVDVFTRSDRGQKVATVDGVRVGPIPHDVILDVAIATCDVVVSHLGDTARAADLAAKWHRPNVRMAHGRITTTDALEGAALVVFNSDNLASSVECPSPWIICHPPVNAARYRTTPGDRVTLVNLSEAKGGSLFWQLARLLSHRKFLGVKGAYGDQCLGEEPNVDMVPNTAAIRDLVYARTRVLLMPSEHETWGMTAVEAMASGIPVIAHPTGGLIESLGPAGIFVDRDDLNGWAGQIERLHDPTEWAAASRVSLARSAELDPQPDLDRFAEHLGRTCESSSSSHAALTTADATSSGSTSNNDGHSSSPTGPSTKATTTPDHSTGPQPSTKLPPPAATGTLRSSPTATVSSANHRSKQPSIPAPAQGR